MRKKKVIAVCIIFAFLVSGVMYWIYRNPDYQYQKDGVLSADSGVAVTSSGLIPKDIEKNSLKWAETLRQQHDLYETQYVSHEVIYSTTAQNGETTIVFQGTGITNRNETEEIYDTITLPFELYGVNKK